MRTVPKVLSAGLLALASAPGPGSTGTWAALASTRTVHGRLPGTSTCARFFGGMTSASKYALMWQWSGGGGITNGVGDFDQIDLARMK
jgi:hypothetical protein